jgi:hypothetical protein
MVKNIGNNYFSYFHLSLIEEQANVKYTKIEE